MEKSPEAFRTISEVADWLDTPAHVLRFWESRFPEIAPVKRAGGRRYYRPEDMQLLGGIKHLLHTEGHTIKSVQERLKAGGTGAICAFSPPLAAGPAEAEDAAGADDPAVANGHDDAAVEPAAIWREAVPGPDDGLVAAASGEPEIASADGVPGLHAPLWEAGPEGPGEELPPIGFFFDDSDDAAPAEDQSGTFAAQAPEADSAAFPGPANEPADAAAPDVLLPLPDMPADAADGEDLGAPVLPMAAELRGLTRRDLPLGWREKLPEIVRRLDRLCRDDR